MELGLPYVAFARVPEHGSWLCNVWDRHALRAICTSGSALHQQDLAQSIEEHFQEVLDQLNEMDAVEDSAPAEEEGELA